MSTATATATATATVTAQPPAPAPQQPQVTVDEAVNLAAIRINRGAHIVEVRHPSGYYIYPALRVFADDVEIMVLKERVDAGLFPDATWCTTDVHVFPGLNRLTYQLHASGVRADPETGKLIVGRPFAPGTFVRASAPLHHSTNGPVTAGEKIELCAATSFVYAAEGVCEVDLTTRLSVPLPTVVFTPPLAAAPKIRFVPVEATD